MNTFILISLLLVAAVYGSKFSHYQQDDFEEMQGDAAKGPEVKLNFDDSCATLINELIALKMDATYQSTAIAVFFRRHNVDIVGLSLMYNAWARIKVNSAKDLMMYLVKRGATVEFSDIAQPAETQWAGPEGALERSLKVERRIAQKINDLVKHAEEHYDAHLLAYIERELVNEAADNIFEVAALINKLAKGGSKFGVLAINSQLVKKYKGFKDDTSDTERYKWNY